MASGLNKVQLIGNLGQDAELRYVANGEAVATVSIATTEHWKGNDGAPKERTEWHRVVVWGKTAEALAEYLVKGKQVYVEGRLQTRKWEKDGITRYTTEIRSDKIILLGGGKQGGGSAVPHPADSASADNLPDDEIPF